MFDRQKFMSAVSGFGAKVSKATAKYIPAALSEDKRFSNAYAACLSLLVCADLEVEADETIAAIGFMQNDQSLKGRDLVLSTLEFYGSFIGELSESFVTPTDYLLKKAHIIQEHINVDLSTVYKAELLALCNKLVGPGANQQEKSVYAEIMTALL